MLPIDAAGRGQILRTGYSPEGFAPDLVCDPTTITLARMRNFDDLDGGAPRLSFSPIVFLANASYVQQPKTEEPAAGRVAATEDPEVFCQDKKARLADPIVEHESPKRKWYQPSLLPVDPEEPEKSAEPTYEIWGYVEGSTIGEAIGAAIDRVGDRQIVCAIALPSHADAAEQFCNGKIFRYFGDIEIIQAALSEWFRKNKRQCLTDQRGPTGATYEPYAFVLSSNCRPEFPERFTRALYAMFAEGTIDQLFEKRFPGRKSDYLSTLFRINGIPKGNGPDLPPPPADTVTLALRSCQSGP